jgi:hypothetical protein
MRSVDFDGFAKDASGSIGVLCYQFSRSLLSDLIRIGVCCLPFLLVERRCVAIALLQNSLHHPAVSPRLP